jgi:hypothetical protein
LADGGAAVEVRTLAPALSKAGTRRHQHLMPGPAERLKFFPAQQRAAIAVSCGAVRAAIG